MKDQPTILIVDDEEDILTIYRSYFEGQGFHTLVAHDGAEGLSVIQKHIPDVILLDLMMPNMNGHEMLKHLKEDEALKHIPVVIVTAMIKDLAKQETIDAGAYEYLEKSDIDDPADLLPSVQRALAHQTTPTPPTTEQLC